MKMIFEDARDTPSSKLLQKSCNGSNIVFSRAGASKVAETVDSCIKEDLVIVFYDVVPDNLSTVYDYYRLMEAYSDFDNIKIIPIPCIEYFVLDMLLNYHYIAQVQKILNIFMLKKNSIEYKDKSFEKYCKHLLSDLSSESFCLRNEKPNINSSKSSNQQQGLFYLVGCPCENWCRLHTDDIPLEVKANHLYSRLPVIFIDDCNSTVSVSYVHETTWKEVEQERNAFYKKLCEALGIENIGLLTIVDK